MEKKDEYWKIIKGKCTLKEAAMIMGIREKVADRVLEDVKKADIHDSTNYFAVSSMVVKAAYHKLIELGEIDTTRIFNLGNNDYDGEDIARHGDIGIRGNQNFIFNNGWNEW